MKGIVAAAIAASLVGGAAHATAVVDQSYVLPTTAAGYGGNDFGYNSGNDSTFQQLQSVTAGMTGLLSSLDLELARVSGTGTIGISIIENFAIDGAGHVSGTTTKVASFAETAAPDFNGYDLPLVSIDISAANIFVTAGESFAILADVSGADAGLVSWIDFGGGMSNGYAGGTSYASSNGGATYAFQGPDAGFQTFVDADPSSDVPEPATWELTLAGFGLLGTALRQRRAEAVAAK